MSSIVTELDAFGPTVTVPDDGDSAGAASVTAAGVGFQELANRTLYLKNRLLPSAGSPLLVRRCSTPLRIDEYAWSLNAGEWLNTTANQGHFNFDIPYEKDSEIVTITATHFPPAGSFAAAGGAGFLAKIALRSMNMTTQALTLIETFEDPAANAGAYDIIHSFTLTLATPQAMDENLRHFIDWIDDSGAVINKFFQQAKYGIRAV